MLGHELAHVRERDTVVTSLPAGLAGLTMLALGPAGERVWPLEGLAGYPR